MLHVWIPSARNHLFYLVGAHVFNMLNVMNKIHFSLGFSFMNGKFSSCWFSIWNSVTHRKKIMIRHFLTLFSKVSQTGSNSPTSNRYHHKQTEIKRLNKRKTLSLACQKKSQKIFLSLINFASYYDQLYLRMTESLMTGISKNVGRSQ